MRSWLVLGAAACLLVAAVAAEAPATLVDGQVETLSHGRLRVTDAAGTVWNGSGTLIVLPYAARVPVFWHIDALPLLLSRLRGTLGRDSAESQPAAFDLSSDDFAVRRFAIALPAEAVLRAIDAPALIAGAGGTMDLSADAFSMRRGVFDGTFVARWRGSSLPGPRPEVRVAIGDVRVDGVGTGGEIKAALSNVGGDIEISGTLILAATGAVRVEALVRPRAGIDAERSKAIAASLSMIGSADGSGGFRLVWQATGR